MKMSIAIFCQATHSHKSPGDSENILRSEVLEVDQLKSVGKWGL